ncbi:MAG: hypothetical protein RLZZ117_1583 [Cyanobacteriota bacterium]|jgi:hypothetical protein
MAPRRLLLHAGPHKTGTSSIQAILRDRGFKSFYYPRTGQWYDGAHHQLIFSLIPELRRPDGESIEPNDLEMLLKTELESVKHDTLLISSEYLSGECLPRVLDWLISRQIADPKDVRGILVERDMLSRAASLYNQSVKDPYIGERRSPDQWFHDERSNLLLEPMVNRMRSAGIMVDVLPYEPASSLASRFLLAVGAHADEIPEQIPWENMSMSKSVLLALLDINRSIADPLERIAQRTRLFETHQPAFELSTATLFSCSSEPMH